MILIRQPGQSGNPSRHSGEYGLAIKLARQAAPYVINRLIELMDSEDERVAVVACNAILGRGFGKPGPANSDKSDMELRLAKMTREERMAEMRRLLEPVQRYLPPPKKTTTLTPRELKWRRALAGPSARIAGSTSEFQHREPR